jgi:hypothetical protein
MGTLEMSAIPNHFYEEKKQMLEDFKVLSKEEYAEVFRIIKRHDVEYSENSNGIFFDLTQCSPLVFEKLLQFIELTKTQRKNEQERTNELETLRSETSEQPKE